MNAFRGRSPPLPGRRDRPGGSTTEQEEAAARYAAGVFPDAGLAPVPETFSSARSAWLPYALAFGLILAGEVRFLCAGRWRVGSALPTESHTFVWSKLCLLTDADRSET